MDYKTLDQCHADAVRLRGEFYAFVAERGQLSDGDAEKRLEALGTEINHLAGRLDSLRRLSGLESADTMGGPD